MVADRGGLNGVQPPVENCCQVPESVKEGLIFERWGLIAFFPMSTLSQGTCNHPHLHERKTCIGRKDESGITAGFLRDAYKTPGVKLSLRTILIPVYFNPFGLIMV